MLRQRASAVPALRILFLALLLPLGCRTQGARARGDAGPADLIVLNARVTTQDPGQPDARAFAVRDGLFVAVGSEEQVAALRGDATRVIDAEGRRVIPGLVDSHLHAVRGGRFYNLELRWEGVESLADGLAMIREQARRTPPGQWVRVVGGWSPYQFRERRMPTVAELDAAAPDVPVLVLFLYSQALLNRAGAEALGITAETAAPPGGRYELVPGGGAILHAEPSPAILYGTLAKLPQLSAPDQLNSTQHFYRELNRFGLTGAIDAGGGGHSYPEDYEATRQLALRPGMPLRISSYLFAQTKGRELEDIRRWTAEERLELDRAVERLNGYVTEGAGELLVWSAGDFENFLAPRPELEAGMEAELSAVARVLALSAWPIRIHATYDESISRVLDVLEPIFRETGYQARWCIDHAETISARNVERIRALGGGVAIQDRMAFAGELFAERYGPEAARDAPPLRRLLDAGLPLGAGTDATRVSSYNPWVALAWLVSGRTVGGTLLAAPENRLSRAEALRLYTLGSAWFSGEETVKGRIAPGQYADFAILSGDFFSVPEEELRSIESVLTAVGGDVVYASGPFAPLAPPPLPAVSPAWSPVAHFGGHAPSGGRREPVKH
jgi:predicted amidohydrolase YtcJ